MSKLLSLLTFYKMTALKMLRDCTTWSFWNARALSQPGWVLWAQHPAASDRKTSESGRAASQPALGSLHAGAPVTLPVWLSLTRETCPEASLSSLGRPQYSFSSVGQNLSPFNFHPLVEISALWRQINPVLCPLGPSFMCIKPGSRPPHTSFSS